MKQINSAEFSDSCGVTARFEVFIEVCTEESGHLGCDFLVGWVVHYILKGSVFLWTVRTLSTSGTVLHPKRPEYASVPLFFTLC